MQLEAVIGGVEDLRDRTERLRDACRQFGHEDAAEELDEFWMCLDGMLTNLEAEQRMLSGDDTDLFPYEDLVGVAEEDVLLDVDGDLWEEEV